MCIVGCLRAPLCGANGDHVLGAQRGDAVGELLGDGGCIGPLAVGNRPFEASPERGHNGVGSGEFGTGIWNLTTMHGAARRACAL